MEQKHPFDWQRYPKVEQWLYSLLRAYQEKNPALLALETELSEKTSSRLFDWIDHLVLEASPSLEKELAESYYSLEITTPTYRVYTHFGAKFPRLLVREAGKVPSLGVAVVVESIADFLQVRGLHREIEGSPKSPFRRATIRTENGVALFAVERRGTRILEPLYMTGSYLEDYLTSLELWESRSRNEEEVSMQAALRLADETVRRLGSGVAAWIVLETERKLWQARNFAGAVQKARQDMLGMGWANHDHHTFRSSRRHFVNLVRLFETLGFTCRECFHAGKEAGWGAQVMESTETGLVLFLDVDLTPEELETDIAHHPLIDREKLGTVGLWCELHGDSILEAGMHHLEAQFDFDLMSSALKKRGIEMMTPFSDFPYLRQAFTAGERWAVNPERIDKLVRSGRITRDEADTFFKEGALGSHLENLQRKEGYKGFNKDNVSLIIRATDPRKHSAEEIKSSGID